MKELEIASELRRKEPLSDHTYLSVGGVAEYFLFAESIDDMIKSIEFAREMGLPFYIIGEGSNVLFLDEGFSGMVITTERMDRITIDDVNCFCESGTLLIKIIECCKEYGLTGLESLAGIPGTIGGAVRMNAGAYGTEIGTLVSSVSVLKDGSVVQLEDVHFSYRKSSLKGEIVLKVTLSLIRRNKKEVSENIEMIMKKRRGIMSEIPIDSGTCGSVFKNPEGRYAGKLIEEANLKGKRVGGAWVSMGHANFIFTDKTAKSSDVMDLIRLIRDEVERNSNIRLKTEVVIVGKGQEIEI